MTTGKTDGGASARRRKQAAPAPSPDPDKSEALASLVMRPSLNGAAVVSAYAGAFGASDEDLNALMDQLVADMQVASSGDTKRSEAMLFSQAHALQAIFMSLARRAQRQELLPHWEAYLRMALKAQNQCRMTLETLATIKNPPFVIARQANINNGGQQQVNNGLVPAAERANARAANPATAPTELLEQQHGEWLDPGASGAASGANSQLAPVGEVQRSADR